MSNGLPITAGVTTSDDLRLERPCHVGKTRTVSFAFIYQVTSGVEKAHNMNTKLLNRYKTIYSAYQETGAN